MMIDCNTIPQFKYYDRLGSHAYEDIRSSPTNRFGFKYVHSTYDTRACDMFNAAQLPVKEFYHLDHLTEDKRN